MNGAEVLIANTPTVSVVTMRRKEGLEEGDTTPAELKGE
jgi:hypothetical protein